MHIRKHTVVFMCYEFRVGHLSCNGSKQPQNACVTAHKISWRRVHAVSVYCLPYWDRVTHICASKLTVIGPDNGLSPGRRQAIIWTNAGLLLIWPLGTNLSDILLEVQKYTRGQRYGISTTKWHLREFDQYLLFLVICSIAKRNTVDLIDPLRNQIEWPNTVSIVWGPLRLKRRKKWVQG